MTRPPVTLVDMKRLHAESLESHHRMGPDLSVWVEREGFEPAALSWIAAFLTSTYGEFCVQEGEVPDARLIALGAFVAGWDAHRDLRGEREE